MRNISIICLFTLAAPLCFAQASAPIATLVDQAPVLAVLDHDNSSPLSLVTLFGKIHAAQRLPVPSPAVGPSRASDLSRFGETYGQFASVMSADMTRIISGLGIDWEKEILRTYDPKSAKTEAGKTLRLNGNVARVFNEKWLGSNDGLFILAGVTNRIDRRDFDPAHCGELRFIYRLGYEVAMNGKTYASRMPFTVNMVFSYGDDGKHCQDIASLWRIDGMDGGDPKIVAQRLLQGPLDFSKLTFKQIEINAQVVRFPSDLENMENRKFAGQAIYWMRIFAFNGGKFQPTKLENTPDVQAILKDSAKQKQLLEYLASHVAEIDNGVFNLPENLEADIALTYSTAGSARVANRPFDLLVSQEQAGQIVTALEPTTKSAKFVRSGAGLLERLNTSSCMGCHQSSSTAAAAWPNASPAYSTAGDNMPCPLNTDLADTAKWSCNAARHLTCQAVVTNASASSQLGQCLPAPQNVYAGLSCRSNVIEDSTARNNARDQLSFSLRSFNDRVSREALLYQMPEGKLSGYDYNCRPTKIGVPLGRVTRPCKPDESKLAAIQPGSTPDEICAVVGGKGFEQMAKGYFDSAVFAAGVGRGLLNVCSPSRFCREDYICQEMPDLLTGAKFGVSPQTLATLKSRKIGFCTPTYFVYQLRLDGHPNPR